MRWNPRRLSVLSKRMLFARGAGGKRSSLFNSEQLVVPPGSHFKRNDTLQSRMLRLLQRKLSDR